MQFKVIQRITGILLILFSFTMVPPILFSLFYNDGTLIPFITALVTILFSGILSWFPVRKHRKELKLKDGFYRRR